MATDGSVAASTAFAGLKKNTRHLRCMPQCINDRMLAVIVDTVDDGYVGDSLWAVQVLAMR